MDQPAAIAPAAVAPPVDLELSSLKDRARAVYLRMASNSSRFNWNSGLRRHSEFVDLMVHMGKDFFDWQTAVDTLGPTRLLKALERIEALVEEIFAGGGGAREAANTATEITAFLDDYKRPGGVRQPWTNTATLRWTQKGRASSRTKSATTGIVAGVLAIASLPLVPAQPGFFIFTALSALFAFASLRSAFVGGSSPCDGPQTSGGRVPAAELELTLAPERMTLLANGSQVLDVARDESAGGLVAHRDGTKRRPTEPSLGMQYPAHLHLSAFEPHIRLDALAVPTSSDGRTRLLLHWMGEWWPNATERSTQLPGGRIDLWDTDED